ncbi:MAG: hypothetical protein HN578_04100 [Rhodospirillales bacterium]|nr:hypothetical protein [Rhodospirillaceae bacterium]MBT8002084.1 hypothetical protein [Rhodospirillales bacterium]
MNSFGDKYWNLAQSAAWVIYREKELVDQFEFASRQSFMALGMYPSMEPESRCKLGELHELSRSLIEGQIVAWGYRDGGSIHPEQIPSLEWADLDLAPPFAYHAKYRAAQKQPWTDIRFESAHIRKQWRSVHETSGRTKFDWIRVREIFEEANESNPDFSQNELIDEVQRIFEKLFNKDPPSKTSFLRQIRGWN